MQRLPRTVGQHDVSRLNMAAVLPRLHFSIDLMRSVFVFKERASCSFQVVVKIIYIIDNRGATFGELQLIAVICIIFRFVLVIQLAVHHCTFQRWHTLAVGRHEIKWVCLNLLSGNMQV